MSHARDEVNTRQARGSPVLDSGATDDFQAAGRREAQGSSLLTTLIGLVVVVVWAGAAGLSGSTLGWFVPIVGLATGLTLRLCSTHPDPGTRLVAVVATLLCSIVGHFVAACAAQGIMPDMVVAHWGPVGQGLLRDHVFTARSLLFMVLAGLLALYAPVIGRSR